MPRTDSLDLYLDALSQARATGSGTPETSYYPALSTLLNAVGATLRPRVFCLHHLAGAAAGAHRTGWAPRPEAGHPGGSARGPVSRC